MTQGLAGLRGTLLRHAMPVMRLSGQQKGTNNEQGVQ